jgi:hypothetical protein
MRGVPKEINAPANLPPCEPYALAKMTKQHKDRAPEQATRVLGCVFTDFMGPNYPLSLADAYLYMFTFVAEFSCKC